MWGISWLLEIIKQSLLHGVKQVDAVLCNWNLEVVTDYFLDHLLKFFELAALCTKDVIL